MHRRLIAGLLSLCVVGMLATTAAASDQRADLVNDCVLNVSACDMAGPVVGYVAYNPRANGDLQISVYVRQGAPNTSYDALIWCGPTHNNPIALLASIGTVLTTDASGRGNNTHITVPCRGGITANCGTGGPTGHIDLQCGRQRCLLRRR